VDRCVEQETFADRKGISPSSSFELGDFFLGKGDIELTLSANILISVFYLATVFYVVSLTLLPLQKKAWSIFFLCLGLTANLVSTMIRHLSVWPLLPMYAEPFSLPFCMAVLAVILICLRKTEQGLYIVPLIIIFSLIGVFFPNDFYLPILKSRTIFSHIFFFFTVAAHACFAVGAVQALLFVFRKVEKKSPIFPQFIIWGFFCYSLALFSVQVWSYLGWSSPVVWTNHILTSSAATWFYYACFLHLHLLRKWRAKHRAIFAVAGFVLVFFFNYLPETGKFRMPVSIW